MKVGFGRGQILVGAEQAVEGNAHPSVIPRQVGIVQQPIAGLEVDFWQVEPPVSQLLQQLGEGLDLPLDIGPVLGAGSIGGAQVGVDPLNIQVFHGEDLANLLQVVAGLPQPVLAGVHRQVDGEGFAKLLSRAA